MTDELIIVGVFLLLIFCLGEPDLLDAIIGRISHD